MLKEYIDNMLLDNNDELDRLQVQMKKLLDQLQTHQQWKEKLQREKNKDDNIFSPRSMQFGMDEEIEEAQKKIEETRQNIDYIREKIETYTKKKLEYEMLSNEIKESGLDTKRDNNLKKNETVNISEKLKEKELNIEIRENNKTTEKREKSENSNQEGKFEDSLIEKNTIEKEKVEVFLKNIYKLTEQSLAFVNNDKNRCRNELKKIKEKIKKFSMEIENN